MDRRDFFKKAFFTGSALGLSLFIDNKFKYGDIFAQDNLVSIPDLVAIKGGEADKMFDEGIKAFGGISRFVRKGQTVVIKPNIAWNKTPEYGATTNPKLVARIIEHCLNAGAKKVYVFDHTCDNWEYCYKNSGIENAAKKAGATVVPGNQSKYYQSVDIPKGKSLKKTQVHELILDSDVFINIPILKGHGSCKITSAMKNLIGTVLLMSDFHSKNLHQCIADYCLFKKTTLNIVDAYTIMIRNGPRGRSLDDLKIIKNQLISTDIVAVDAAAAKIFGIEPDSVEYIKIANEMKVGKMDLKQLKIKKISI